MSGEAVNTDYVARAPVTSALTVWMVALYFISPELSSGSIYFFLSPWMHAGWSHLWQNLLAFVLLGVWVESRVWWLEYLAFASFIPYLALHLPALLEFGNYAWGASGLTMALTGYAIPVLLVGLVERVDGFEFEWPEVAIWLVMFFAAMYLSFDAWVTIERFLGTEPRPEGVAVGAHLAGLILGFLWVANRALRGVVLAEE